MWVTVQGAEQIHTLSIGKPQFTRKKFPNHPIFGMQTKFLRQFLHATRCDHQFMGIAFGLYSHILMFNKAASEGVSSR
ncbi:hypothetical protein C8J35_101147 [Rhizobium sp. PP-F2F-G38]|nr:hypothetical protein C8J37_101147 [Rhizobium sp. PP-WC-1G-195]PYF00342.1 hypothetical protein C8J35_101147 [Rhizobium sp. PP-F2F-G38]TCQ28391.1 hypothetical protein C8J33_1011035 [Rhizobium sp. PP-CC-3G-465]